MVIVSPCAETWKQPKLAVLKDLFGYDVVTTSRRIFKPKPLTSEEREVLRDTSFWPLRSDGPKTLKVCTRNHLGHASTANCMHPLDLYTVVVNGRQKSPCECRGDTFCLTLRFSVSFFQEYAHTVAELHKKCQTKLKSLFPPQGSKSL